MTILSFYTFKEKYLLLTFFPLKAEALKGNHQQFNTTTILFHFVLCAFIYIVGKFY